MEKEQETHLVHDLGLGKQQRHAHKTCQTLPQRLIPPLHVDGFSRLFAYGCLLAILSLRSQTLSSAMHYDTSSRIRTQQSCGWFPNLVKGSVSQHRVTLQKGSMI
jgi:hypothetical protein